MIICDRWKGLGLRIQTEKTSTLIIFSPKCVVIPEFLTFVFYISVENSSFMHYTTYVVNCRVKSMEFDLYQVVKTLIQAENSSIFISLSMKCVVKPILLNELFTILYKIPYLGCSLHKLLIAEYKTIALDPFWTTVIIIQTEKCHFLTFRH